MYVYNQTTENIDVFLIFPPFDFRWDLINRLLIQPFCLSNIFFEIYSFLSKRKTENR